MHHKFASHLLMPQELVEQEFRSRFGEAQICARGCESALDAARQVASRSDGDKASLREHFDVSREAMANRLLDLRLVTGTDGFL
jgi:Zn-dependent peptidase ImmA (M78 family)